MNVRRSMLILLLLAWLAAPARGDAWRFVVVGDTRGGDNGVNAQVLGGLASRIVAENAAFVLVPGDLVDSGSLSSFQSWRDVMQPVYGASIGVYPVRGNHDLEGAGAWSAAFGADLPGNGPSGEEGVTYSFTYRNAFIVGLDEYSGHDHRVDQSWLDQQFAANTQPHVFAFGHEPAFKVSHSDCLGSDPSARNAFWSSIAAAGGRTYFAGHDHFYDHARLDDGDGNAHNDLHQYIVGTGGAPLYGGGSYDGDNGPWTPQPIAHGADYGYLLVEIDGLDVTLTWKDAAGNAGDTFAYTAVPEPATAALLSLGAAAALWRRRSLRG